MGPAQKNSLVQIGNADEVTGRAVTRELFRVEGVVAIEKLAAGNGVTAELEIYARDPVKYVGCLVKRAGHTAELSSWTSG